MFFVRKKYANNTCDNNFKSLDESFEKMYFSLVGCGQYCDVYKCLCPVT